MKEIGSPAMPAMKYGYAQRIVLFFCITLVCLIVAVLAISIVGRGEVTTLSLRISTIIQDVLVFVMPPVITAVMVSTLPARLLAIDTCFSLKFLTVATFVMLVSIPAMNALVVWNESLVLPECLSELEAWMRESEETANASVRVLLGGTSVGDLVVSFLIVAVLAGVSEELFFRGALQRLLASGSLNPHVAIWLAAVIFSAFHVQFYGFFPRLFLGAYFGYLLWWSRSIWVPVMAHVFNNGMVVCSMWHSQKAGVEQSGDMNNLGIDSAWMIVASVVLVVIGIGVLRRISLDERKEM